MLYKSYNIINVVHKIHAFSFMHLLKLFGALYSFHHYCMENSDQDIFQKFLLMCFMEKRKSYRFETK